VGEGEGEVGRQGSLYVTQSCRQQRPGPDLTTGALKRWLYARPDRLDCHDVGWRLKLGLIDSSPRWAGRRADDGAGSGLTAAVPINSLESVEGGRMERTGGDQTGGVGGEAGERSSWVRAGGGAGYRVTARNVAEEGSGGGVRKGARARVREER